MIEVGNAIYNSESDFTNYEIVKTNRQRKTKSLYTSQGKRKAMACDPIRSQEDIERARQYFLTTGIRRNRLRNHMLFVLGISLGLRGSDLLSLNIGDVLNSNGKIKNKIVVCEEKTRKINTPYLNDVAKEALRMYFKSLHGDFKMDYPLINNGYSNERMNEDTLYGIMKKLEIGRASCRERV